MDNLLMSKSVLPTDESCDVISWATRKAAKMAATMSQNTAQKLSNNSQSKSGGRLLRKPRVPANIPAPPASPPPRSYCSEINHEYAYYLHGRPRSEEYPAYTSPHPSREEDLLEARVSGYRQMIKSRSSVKRHELKYMLDPVYRDKTSLGTYVEGNSLVQPYKPRGPDRMPVRDPKRIPEIVHFVMDQDELDAELIEKPAFTLQDFMVHLSHAEKVPIEQVKKAVLSCHNYKKLQKLLAERATQQSISVNTINIQFPNNVPSAEPRIPERQLLIELTALYRQQLTMHHNVHPDSVKSAIIPLQKYSPQYPPGYVPPHTEIVVYEGKSGEDTQSEIQQKIQNSEIPAKEGLFHSATAKYFQGSRRSNSPFAVSDQEMISPSELAILDALMAGGKALSLKAHFICQLPEIEPLAQTITYLNLSFNDFTVLPREVLLISQLSVLKLRNNPLRDLPADIGCLSKLRCFVASFCLLTALPTSLFDIPGLRQLDVSYNRITFIPETISHLKKLKYLNLEGNQLMALPVTAMKLSHLRHLCVRHNYMHPLFWKENSNNTPQRLGDLAALCFTQNHLEHCYDNLHLDVENFLIRPSVCDCCREERYGEGLRVIRPVSKIFGVKNLPFLFRCCSTNCRDTFMSNSESLVNVLYGSDT